MALKIIGQPFHNERVTDTLNLAVAQLGLGLALKLGIGNLNRKYRRKPFARVFTA
ncbi:hypothetical protein ES703_08166 [subsurface metagenome]